jgi:hypothetical protein
MRQYHSHSVEQDVEWLYAFDVHANAFFCSFLLTYVLQVLATTPTFTPSALCLFHFIISRPAPTRSFESARPLTNPFIFFFSSSSLLFVPYSQYFLLPVLLGRSVLACILSNTLYALATVWYAYITHLGYRGTKLPILRTFPSSCIKHSPMVMQSSVAVPELT